MRYRKEQEFSHGQTARTAILLMNLGTPDAPTPGAVRRYLRQFLFDPRVVEIPRPLWWLILNGIILWTRPAASAKKYAAVWTNEGSPLRVNGERLAAALRTRFDGENAPLVALAMRYGNPSIDAVLGELRKSGVERILAVPLYPQYAASTTGAAMDAVNAWLARSRNPPEMRWIKHYHDHPAYIDALASRIKAYWSLHGRPEKLLMSFHGLPRYTLDRGDPYHCECYKTARLLAEALGLDAEQWKLSFQSRFGRARWLEPYTSTVLEEWGRAGIARVDVACPGFSADCLETLEELGIEGKQTFLSAGGKAFNLLPCLNDSPEWVDALARILEDHLHGWSAPAPDTGADSRKRALALGAPN